MYIKSMIVQNKNIYVSFWLLLITILVALMIVIGGLTRLTDSGLSITEWNLFTGILPPLNNKDWIEAFSLYKNIPEYKIINPTMTLDEFKIIFFWEYVHRILGRIIGLFYLFPLIYFTIKKSINKKFLKSLYIIFLLICFQGFIGWYMVQSGLVDRTDVSHYRLSLHLTLAFIILVLLLWNYLKYNNENKLSFNKRLPNIFPIFLLTLIIIQISIGAFVSGLDAGQIYNSWPLMNGNYFPDDYYYKDFISTESLNTPSVVQFIHRNVAYFIFIFVLFVLIKIFKNDDFFYLRKAVLLVFISLLLQMFLGIITVLSGAQILIASMHQIGSIILVSTSLILVFKNSKTN